MSKAVLVMNMPEECAKCNLYDHEYDVCEPTEKNVRTFGKPDWCPLRELPKKKPTIGKESDNDILCMNAGYNACIDELLKGEEG